MRGRQIQKKCSHATEGGDGGCCEAVRGGAEPEKPGTATPGSWVSTGRMPRKEPDEEQGRRRLRLSGFIGEDLLNAGAIEAG